MPLQKLQFRPGVNREGTTLANEGGWYDCDKVRFRSGYPEKIGGWAVLSYTTFIGTCRSLWNWVSLKGFNLLGVGTEKKFYIEYGSTYYDITPIRRAIVLTNPFSTTSGSPTVTVTDTGHGAITGDYVSFTGASTVGGLVLNFEYEITYVDSNTYTITAASNASSTATGGGSSVIAQYQLNNGTNIGTFQDGWGAGLWGGVITGSALTQLNGVINNSVTTITVDTTTNFPNAGTLLIDEELITYTFKTSTQFGDGSNPCVRGALGTTAASHLDNALVDDATDYYGWGQSASATVNTQLRLWSQANFGQDLIFNPRQGALYYWSPGDGSTPAVDQRGTRISPFTARINTTNGNASITVTEAEGYITVGTAIVGAGIPAGTVILTGSGYTGTYTLSQNATADGTGVLVDVLVGSQVPTAVNEVLVSDISRIVLAFGSSNFVAPLGDGSYDPLLIRWSTLENYTDWAPLATNQAGDARLSHGSYIVGALQTRQEILVWTDTAIYSMQYLGPPLVWQITLLADNISIASQNAMSTAAGVVYWMGTDKFYVYSGRVETLPCAVRTYVFNDINRDQFSQVVSGTNEGFSEIWWFYCSANSEVIDRYVIFNYLDRVWYYGSMGRTAWLDSPLRGQPVAATLGNQLVFHESGNDDGTTNPPTPIYSYIQSSDFDIGDGHNYGFVWRLLPDITFDGSTTLTGLYPKVTMTMRPRQNPGSAYGAAPSPKVQSTQNYGGLEKNYTVQEFTEIIYTRVRGRQMAFKIESNKPGSENADQLGTQWQLGVPRLDVRSDGRR
jgi:hypothetical protein